ncbi:MAG: EFR1 family ferrodoxin [Promethearchaeota archaeon]
MERKIALIYFSPTNNTANMAKFIIKKLGILEKNLQIDEINITNYSERQHKIVIDQYNALFFGFPIYAWRAPKLVRDWLQTLDGKGKKCSVFFTYGGIEPGASHYNIKRILEEQNFQLISTAEFVCKHTYNCGEWKVMENRPNEFDFEVAEEYIEKTYKRFIGEDNGIVQIENPKISERILLRLEEEIKKNLKPPSRKGEDCSLCRTCENLCPANAMDPNLGEADPNICIRCYRCFLNCPDNTLKIEDLSPMFLLLKKLEKIPVDENKVVSKFFL